MVVLEREGAGARLHQKPHGSFISAQRSICGRDRELECVGDAMALGIEIFKFNVFNFRESHFQNHKS